MLLLSTTSDIVRIISTGAGGAIDVFASWADLSSGTVSPGRTGTKITTNTTTTVVAAPAGSTVRNVKVLWIENVHATLAITIEVQMYDGSNAYRLELITLSPGESLHYNEDIGWEVNDANGIPKTSAPIVIGNQLVAALAADHSNATTSATKVTGLDMALGVGSWIFEYLIVYRSDTTTTGIKVGCNHSGTVSYFVYNAEYVDNLATASSGAADQDALATTAQVLGAYAARAKTTTAPMITASVDTINVDMLLKIEGIAVVTAAGNLELYHGSEAATTTLFKANATAVRATKVQ